MKKLLVILLMACLCLTLVSCVAKSSGNANLDLASSEEVQATTTTTTTSAVTTISTTTAAKPKETTATKGRSASQIVASLINENGTGEIQINMKREEVAKILEKYSVSYKYLGDEYLEIEDGIYYNLGHFEIKQSSKGLKVGDPIERVYELYAGAKEAYVYFKEDDTALFSFKWNNRFEISGNSYQANFIVELNKEKTKVDGIAIGLVGFH
jgi:hypothetical protein